MSVFVFYRLFHGSGFFLSLSEGRDTLPGDGVVPVPRGGDMIYRYSSRRATCEERFDRFLGQHPEIYQEFKRLAHQLLARGIRRYGAKAIMEVIRYSCAISLDEQETFRIDNNYTSMVARKLIEEDSRFNGFFETRKIRNI